MKLTVVFVLAVCVALSYATSDSNENIITVCDALSDRFGCDPAQWTGGNRLRCSNTSKLMSWASRAVRSDCYSVTAGDPSSPAIQYIPDAYTKVYVHVHCYRMLYRGLLLYAVNSAEQKVGSWYLPVENPAWFDKPWKNLPGHVCENTVMHDSAQLKPYHSVIHFKAPPAGTGKITFRTLLKYGNANTGAFYWPLTDLSLNEGAAAASITWEKTAIGQSCTEYCSTKSLYCDITALNSLKTAQSMDAQISPKFTCKYPLLSGCNSDGASFDPNNEYCYYIETNCTGQGRMAPAISLCDAKVADAAKFCACSATRPQTSGATSLGVSQATSGAQTTEFVGAANSVKVSGLFSIAVLVSIFFGANTRTFTLLMLVFGMASAHNWINSFSRSPGASSIPPCKPALTDLPHAQVGPGQPFQIEWMTGHGGPTYFVIMNAKNIDKMILNTFSLLDDYIKNAPNGTNKANDPIYMKYHKKETMGLTNDYSNLTGLFPQPNFFAEQIFANDTRWIQRSPFFKGVNRPYMFSYRPPQLATDAVVSYKSAKYPWIEAVHKYQITTINPGRYDVANFYIPGFGGAGRYIAQYLWNGYRDCVDVDLKPALVQDVYGYPSNLTQWKRIDHCMFDNILQANDYAEVVTNVQYCLDRCQARGPNGCFGVNVVPLKAPADADQTLKPAATDMWSYPNVYGSDMYIPWTMPLFNTTRDTLLANYTNKYICYTALPQLTTDVVEEFVVTSDPKDPIFYSTCYYKLTGNMFNDYLNYTSPYTTVGWRFVDKCIDCKTKAVNTYVDTIPKWSVSNTCINCDREPVSVPKPTTRVVNTVEALAVCDGFGGTFTRAVHSTCPNTTTCVKQLFPLKMPVNQDTNLAECLELAANDAECGNYIMHTAVVPPRCYCYKKQTCCNTCSRKPDTKYNVYELTTVADPTCATGILNGNICCSGTCGAGNCLPVTAIQNPIGFCTNSTITRSCATFGPPCKL